MAGEKLLCSYLSLWIVIPAISGYKLLRMGWRGAFHHPISTGKERNLKEETDPSKNMVNV